MEDPPIEGEVISESDPQIEQDQDLERYLNEVVTGGFPLTLLERTLSVFKGLAYGCGCAVVGVFAYVFGWAGIDVFSGLRVIGIIVLMLDALAWMTVLYLAMLSLGNLAAALAGRMPLRMRAANERFEA